MGVKQVWESPCTASASHLAPHCTGLALTPLEGLRQSEKTSLQPLACSGVGG